MADMCEKAVSERVSPVKCREARRRRIEMRRFAVTAAAGDVAPKPVEPGQGEKRQEEEPDRLSGDMRNLKAGGDPSPFSGSSSSSSSSGSGGGRGAEAPVIAAISLELPAVDSPPAFGAVSLSGRSREMEDAVSLRPGFFRRSSGGLPLHFFAVFDGHGGSHVAALCKERMHVLLVEELSKVTQNLAAEAEEGGWRAAVQRCFGLMDDMALSSCACGRVGDSPCGCERSGITSEIVGSTAVVAVISVRHVLLANCGDSRAVLCRGGLAIPLSEDQKPDRPDEMARIEAAGGRVIYLNGARVHGILAMSRAIGDKYLKPAVISDPEISIVERTSEDECLIIASDGLWDVVSNDMACEVARRCLRERNPLRGPKGLSSRVIENSIGGDGEVCASEARCYLAAALLTRLALERMSSDNISVIVVDLRSG